MDFVLCKKFGVFFFTHADNQILALSKLKAFAHDLPLFNTASNIFTNFHNVFIRLFPHWCQKSSLCGKGLTLSTLSQLLMTLTQKAFENIVKKEKMLVKRQKSLLQQHLICRLQMLSIWSGPKFFRSVKS